MVQLFVRCNLCLRGQSFLELRDMQHRMNFAGAGQLQFVGHCPYMLQNQVRPKVFKTQFMVTSPIHRLLDMWL
jgi:hypothetical protein